MVILVVGTGRLKIPVSLRQCFAVGLAENIELKFRRHLCRQALFRKAGDLAFQHCARGLGNVVAAMVIHDVADDHRRAGRPGREAQRGKIGLHRVIAVTLRPTGRRIAGHRLHFLVDRQKVIARMRFRYAGFEEVTGVEPLAHHPPLHVDLGHDDGIDFPLVHEVGECFQRKRWGHAKFLLSRSRPRKRASGAASLAAPFVGAPVRCRPSVDRTIRCTSGSFSRWCRADRPG